MKRSEAGSSFFLGLYHRNNRLENISSVYLPLISPVVKITAF